MAKNTGDGGRRGAIRDRVQIENPITGTFIKLDTTTGRVVEQKRTPGPFKGVRVLNEKPAAPASKKVPSSKKPAPKKGSR